MPFDGLLYPKRQPPRLLPAGQFELDRTHHLAAGLIGCWPLNGDARDYSGAGLSGTGLTGVHNGTLVGSPLTIIGPQGPCLSLNGSTQYVTVGSGYNPLNITMSIWVRLTSLAPAYSCVMGFSDVNNYTQLLVKSSGKLACYAGGGGGANYDGSGSHTLTTGVWYHLVMTYAGAGLAGYVNGTLDGSAAVAGGVSLGTITLVIGQDLGNSGRLLAGQMSNVTVYNRGLSAAEVARLYAEPYALLRPVARRAVTARMVAVAPVTDTGRAIILA